MKSNTLIVAVAACLLSATYSPFVFAKNMSEEDRMAAIIREMDCLSRTIEKGGVDWNDVCYSSENPSRLDKDRLVTKSMDQMIDEQGVMADDMLKEQADGQRAEQARSVDDVAYEQSNYANSEKNVDDVIAEQGVENNYEYGSDESSDDDNAARNDDMVSNQNERPQYVQYAQNNNSDESYQEPVDFTPQGSLKSSTSGSLMDREQNQNKAEMGIEFNRYRYVEPIFDLVTKGTLYGAYIDYTVRPSKSDALYEDIVDMYKFEGRFNYGLVDYKSAGSGTLEDDHDFTFEGRLLAGKDFGVGGDSRLTPFLGIGFRYLNDDSSGKTTSTGARGYERESRYIYVPIGVEFTTHLTRDWRVAPTLEYDIFLEGTQNSHLSDVDAGLPDVKNDQRNGFGLRGSVKFIKVANPINLVVEPYIRFWHIQDSDETTAAGPLYIVSGLEPENKTTEYGIKLGAQF